MSSKRKTKSKLITDKKEVDRYQRLIERIEACEEAHDNLVRFSQLMMPDYKDAEDVNLSRYIKARHIEVLAHALEMVEAGKIKRLIVNMPPRMGKSQLASKFFIPWYSGRNPANSVIFGTYNQTLAEDFGRAVRDTMENPVFNQVFESAVLRKNSRASDRLQTEEGGILAFLGRGGASTGRGADLVVVDDALKNREEADSVLVREAMWTWFTQAILTRFQDETGRAVLIQCMTGDTRVLMADGTETLLKDIRPGAKIATYKDGKLATSTVLNWTNNHADKVWQIKTSSGITFKANERHPFLVFEDGQEKWIRLKDLRLGHAIFRVNGASGRTDLVSQKAARSLQSAEGIAPRTTIKFGGRKGFGLLPSTLKLAAKRTLSTATASLRQITTGCSKSKAASALCASSHPATMYAPTGVASSASITATTQGRFAHSFATAATWLSDTLKRLKWPQQQPTISDFTLETVVEISPAGVEDVFDIQVAETENFIANGVVSHNTRWHEDDLVGRITDKTNPHYDREEAKKWHIIDLPAIAIGDDDPLGRKPGEALWPEKFSVNYLKSLQRTDPRGFNALYQGRPAPENGAFFLSQNMKTYKNYMLPKREDMRVYIASDHAVSSRQDRDKTCIIPMGVDRDNNIWILPDVWWRGTSTDVVVDAMLALIKKYKPIFWWAERGHITKSIGPFLRKRMLEEHIHCSIIEISPTVDKQSRAQSIQGRMAMGKVFFPEFAPWFGEARDQMMKFPNASRDDFVDALAYLGLGMALHVPASGPNAKHAREAQEGNNIPGTYGWLKSHTGAYERRRFNSLNGGW